MFSTQVPRLYFTWAKQSVFYPQLKMYTLPSCPPSILPAYKLYYTPTKLEIDRCTRNGIITLSSYSGCNNCNLITLLQDVFLVVQAVQKPEHLGCNHPSYVSCSQPKYLGYAIPIYMSYILPSVSYSVLTGCTVCITTQCSIVIKTCCTEFS